MGHERKVETLPHKCGISPVLDLLSDLEAVVSIVVRPCLLCMLLVPDPSAPRCETRSYNRSANAGTTLGSKEAPFFG
eukprot:5674333-Pyramimonas_sp.AAC.1